MAIDTSRELLHSPDLRDSSPRNRELYLPGKETAATQLGERYVLLEKIGEGGFGDVWVAEQLEPVKRRVAIKILRRRMDTRQVVARFHSQRHLFAGRAA